MNNKMILVDIYDNEIGYASKEVTHMNGYLHRAFSIFLFNKDKIILQKRAHNKYHSGGLWSNACCSHPMKNESLENAVNRRMLEEIGVECDTKEIASIIYYKKFEENLYEYEYDHIFIGSYEKDLFRIDSNEIEEIKIIDIEYLEKDIIKNPNKYTIWFISTLPIVLKYIKHKNIN